MGKQKVSDKRLIEVKDIPYGYIDSYQLTDGNLDDIIKYATGLREQIRSHIVGTYCVEYIKKFEQVETIVLASDYDDGGYIGLRFYRLETDEEVKKRMSNNRAIAKGLRESNAKKALEKIEAEKALYLKLKEKYNGEED